jgi:hypothetical protein
MPPTDPRFRTRPHPDDPNLPVALPVNDPAPAAPAAPRRALLDLILDPRSIQGLLVLGSVLLVTGLVLWLYAIGVFENPTVVAALMGTGTLGLMFGGWGVLRKTRYQTAGRALTLLACLVMPLNLWFYHAQGLHPFTLFEQLWVAALVCCALYAASAWVLRDPLFVYTLVGGVTVSALLLLASVDGPAEFWQVTHPAILLSVLGLVCLHVARAFPEQEEGDFSRKKFGLPFFWSGHVVLALGLLLVLGAQLYAGWYRLALPTDLPGPAPLTVDRSLKVLALLLVLAGTYAYLYSDLVGRRAGLYLFGAVFTLLWAEVLAIDLLGVRLTAVVYPLTFAATGLALLSASRWWRLKGAVGRCGNALVVFASAAGALLTLAHLARGPAEVRADLTAMLLALALGSLAAIALVPSSGWRRGYVVAVFANILLTVLVLMVQLGPWQQLEVTAVTLGAGLVVLGLIGWQRGDRRHDDLVSFGLFLGSGLVALPLTVAVLTYRTLGVFHWPDELALLAAGVVLFGVGFVGRLKAPTLAGIFQLLLYVLTLLVYLPWSQWNLAAIFLMAGGGGLFALGLVLSLFRDRLRELPQRIKQRTGVFRVLSWR